MFRAPTWIDIIYYIGGWSGTRKCKDYIESNAAFEPDLVEPNEGGLLTPWSNVDKEALELQACALSIVFIKSTFSQLRGASMT